ncbi:MAG: SRPBCC domain-containing protein [Streptosporangiaceae bacterium]
MFRAWTAPEHLRHWRAPRGFELVVCDVDLRAGGGCRFVHRAPDGSQHAFRCRYRGIEPPSRLVSTFTCEAAPETEALDEVTFEDNAAAPPWSPGERPSPPSRRGNSTPPRAPGAG